MDAANPRYSGMFVWLSCTQTLATVIKGCEAARESFGGVFLCRSKIGFWL
jgi:hypothetical protein